MEQSLSLLIVVSSMYLLAFWFGMLITGLLVEMAVPVNVLDRSPIAAKLMLLSLLVLLSVFFGGGLYHTWTGRSGLVRSKAPVIQTGRSAPS